MQNWVFILTITIKREPFLRKDLFFAVPTTHPPTWAVTRGSRWHLIYQTLQGCCGSRRFAAMKLDNLFNYDVCEGGEANESGSLYAIKRVLEKRSSFDTSGTERKVIKESSWKNTAKSTHSNARWCIYVVKVSIWHTIFALASRLRPIFQPLATMIRKTGREHLPSQSPICTR